MAAPETIASEMSTRNSKISWQQKSWALDLITAGELLKPGMPVLNALAREMLVNLYCGLLAEIGRERLEQAYRYVLETSKFRPDISELRAAAGVALRNPYEVAALTDLQFLFGAMRVHGRTVRKVYDDTRETVLTPPTLPESAEQTLVELGFGAKQAGLDLIWQHPALDCAREQDELAEMPYRSAEKIEAKWVSAWIRVNA